MPRASQHPKEQSFNFRIDPALKAAFQSAAEAADKPAAQVLRDFMRHYMARHQEAAFASEAHRQSAAIASRAADPASDEAAVLAELDMHLADLGAEWQ
jgi:predicted transcriptional regulator